MAASVVPAVNEALKFAVKKILKLELCLVGPGVKTGLNIKIDNPAQLGADLVVGGVAAVAKYPLPCIIFDMGTANTISVINGRENFSAEQFRREWEFLSTRWLQRRLSCPTSTLKTPRR